MKLIVDEVAVVVMMEVEAREGGQAEADVMDDHYIGEHRGDRHGQRRTSLYRWFDCRG
jgi:hypothetical protein